MLIGGTTADKTVSSADVSRTRGQVGQPVTNSNFREDVRSGESINATAVRLVRSNVGHSLRKPFQQGRRRQETLADRGITLRVSCNELDGLTDWLLRDLCALLFCSDLGAVQED